MLNPEISVLMPVYNGGRFLKGAIESILVQTFSNFEFIIIDDGSTDGSLEILKKYSNSDPRIRLVSRENRGLVESLNEGISMVRSPLIARMDADDISLFNRLKVQKEFMDDHPDCICVGARVRVIDSKGRFLIDNAIQLKHDEIIKSALQGVSPIIHPTAMIRAETIKAIGGYDQNNYPAEDLALWIDLSEHGKLTNLDAPLLEYRIHDGSISTSEHTRQITKTVEICQRACEKRKVKFEMKGRVGRPGGSRESKFLIVLRHGWWAHSSQQWDTSAIYALKAITWSPFHEGGWRLLFCAFFRRG